MDVTSAARKLLFSHGTVDVQRVQTRGELQMYLGCLLVCFFTILQAQEEKSLSISTALTCQAMCSAPDGLRCKVPGLLPRLPLPQLYTAESHVPYCLPELPCGSDYGAPCCTEGAACFGKDERGAALSCREGFCLTCGVPGHPPCASASLHCFLYSL
jgi:hypothetical protein